MTALEIGYQVPLAAVRPQFPTLPTGRGIYAITQDSTKRAYIGKAQDLKARWSAHADSLARGIHSNAALLKAFQESQGEGFTCEVLELLPQENWNQQSRVAELLWIRHFGSNTDLFNGARDIRLATEGVPLEVMVRFPAEAYEDSGVFRQLSATERGLLILEALRARREAAGQPALLEAPQHQCHAQRQGRQDA